MDMHQTICERKGRKFLFKVETSQKLSDFAKYETIRNEIWGAPRDHLAGPRNLGVENFFHEGSNLLTSVYVENADGNFQEDEFSLVGFSYGYIGARDKKIAFRKQENIVFYSQYIGVKAEYQNYGLGILLKEFQKRIVLDVYGLSVITCTCDPLVSVNAYRNVRHFRMNVEEYRTACYGTYEGKLNRADVPSDRLFLTWNLKEEARLPEYDLKKLVGSGHALVLSDVSEVMGVSGTLSLEIVKRIQVHLHHDLLLVEVPFDFYTMLQETAVPDEEVRRIPLDWRMVTRQVFLDLFRRDYKVLDFAMLKEGDRRRGFYVFSAAGSEKVKTFQ
ncbi:MAG: hypothetical protein JXB23_14875 [Candidatus Aminicenantes bacterium]|nr:hypothetical protein [Candidatus Aminicenantes bacterium]